jgi:hypothetical protein
MYTTTHTTAHVTRYYACGQEGYYTKDCLSGNVKPEVALVLDLYKSAGKSTSKSEEESEVEKPGKEQP